MPCTSAWAQSWLRCLEKGVRAAEPVLAAAAAFLVLLAAYVYFSSILPEIFRASGLALAALHTVWAAFLLFSVLFNHAMCVFTPPGSTNDVDPQLLQEKMTFEWRWCRRCARPKPPLSHHCSICNKCVYKLDHHCVWMANCIGWGNYRYFYLFLTYMWVGSLYVAVVIFTHTQPWLLDLDGGYAHAQRSALLLRLRHDPTGSSATLHAALPEYVTTARSDGVGLLATGPGSVLPFIVFVLACAVFVAVGVLLGWQTWLVASGQGTIDCLQNRADKQEAEAAGSSWSNPYNLGCAANWRETFDASGRFWWLTWAGPSMRRKRGCGYLPPRCASAQDPTEAELGWVGPGAER